MLELKKSKIIVLSYSLFPVFDKHILIEKKQCNAQFLLLLYCDTVDCSFLIAGLVLLQTNKKSRRVNFLQWSDPINWARAVSLFELPMFVGVLPFVQGCLSPQRAFS